MSAWLEWYCRRPKADANVTLSQMGDQRGSPPWHHVIANVTPGGLVLAHCLLQIGMESGLKWHDLAEQSLPLAVAPSKATSTANEKLRATISVPKNGGVQLSSAEIPFMGMRFMKAYDPQWMCHADFTLVLHSLCLKAPGRCWDWRLTSADVAWGLLSGQGQWLLQRIRPCPTKTHSCTNRPKRISWYSLIPTEAS